jgi:hypothetical protein
MKKILDKSIRKSRHCELAKQSIVFFWIASQARNDGYSNEIRFYVIKKTLSLPPQKQVP